MESLDSKVEISYGYLNKIFKRLDNSLEKLYVSWTGGKDSTVVLHLLLKFLKEKKIGFIPKVLFIDTGFTFPEIMEFMDKFGTLYKFDLSIVRPDVDIQKYPKADVVSCCRDLKITPLKKRLLEILILELF